MGNDYSYLKTEYGTGNTKRSSFIDYKRKLELRYGKKTAKNMIEKISGIFYINVYGYRFEIECWKTNGKEEYMCCIDYKEPFIRGFI